MIRRAIAAALLGGLFLLAYVVLQPFLVPLAWAAILAFVTWPLNTRVRKWLGGSPTASALVMTLALTAAFVIPILWLIVLMRGELAQAYQLVVAYLAKGPHQLPEAIARIPWLGDWLQDWLTRATSDPALLRTELTQWFRERSDEVGKVLGGVGRNAVKFGFSLLSVFFLYREGETIIAQLRRVLERFTGERIHGYIAAVGDTTKAVVYGLVLTALAQGLLAGLGYWVAGLQAPVLLGAFTALIALIPFGTPFVWGSIGVWLVLNGDVVAGVGLLLWGTLVISWVDNLIRPFVISSATRIPFLLVMFGVLGGLAAFGLIGLFVGPVILAVVMAVWREWLEEQRASPGAAIGSD